MSHTLEVFYRVYILFMYTLGKTINGFQAYWAGVTSGGAQGITWGAGH